MIPSKFSPSELIGVFFSGFHGIPCTYVLPSVSTAAYNAVSYGPPPPNEPPNGAAGKFQNNKVQPFATIILKY